MTKQKTRLGRKVQNAKSYEQAQKAEQEYNDADQNQTKVSFPLKKSMLQEDLKTSFRGAVGWIKNAKGCLRTCYCLYVYNRRWRAGAYSFCIIKCIMVL